MAGFEITLRARGIYCRHTRSFCNGPYFKPFREALLSQAQLTQIHVFDSRTAAFSDAEVLQENVIFRAVKSADHDCKTLLSTSVGPHDADVKVREVASHELVAANDPNQVIHLVQDNCNLKLLRASEI